MGFETKSLAFYRQKIRNILADLAPTISTVDETIFNDVFITSVIKNLNKFSISALELATIQSALYATGTDLDELGSQYNITRKEGIGARGVVLLTKATLDALAFVTITTNDYVVSNERTYTILGNYIMSGANRSAHANMTTRYADTLEAADITDQYGILVNVECTDIGEDTDVVSNTVFAETNIEGIDNAINPSAITGGRDEEDDATYRKRILLAILGNIIGTSNNYKKTALSIPAVTDAKVIGPDDDLMTRDGRRVDEDGNILDEGTGGKVDVYIEGSDPTAVRDSYVYTDQSGSDDATSTSNDHLLGQELLENESYYKQPAISISSVTGSTTGANYVNDTHYELRKDIDQTTATPEAGSYQGNDVLHWLASSIELEGESVTKGVINSKDTLTYGQILDVTQIQGSIDLEYENPTTRGTFTVTTLHRPVTAVSRIYNKTTGETYSLTSFDEDTGVITFTGTIAPAAADILEVDYSWGIIYSDLIDYQLDQDTIDWSHDKEALETLTLLPTQPIATEEPVVVEDEDSAASSSVVTVENDHIASVESFIAYDLSVLDQYAGGEPIQPDETTTVNLTYKKINNRDNRHYDPEALQQIEFTENDIGGSQTSLSFTDKETFLNEVKTADELGQPGDYQVDYVEGAVNTFVVPGYRRQIGSITESLKATAPKVKTVSISLSQGVNEVEFNDLLLNITNE
jgi:hypothetical protein